MRNYTSEKQNERSRTYQHHNPSDMQIVRFEDSGQGRRQLIIKWPNDMADETPFCVYYKVQIFLEKSKLEKRWYSWRILEEKL